MSIKQTLQELSKILDTSYDNLADKVFRRVLEMREESPEEKQGSFPKRVGSVL